MSSTSVVVHWLQDGELFYNLETHIRGWVSDNRRHYPPPVFEFVSKTGNVWFQGILTSYAFGGEPDGTSTCLFCLNGQWIKVCYDIHMTRRSNAQWPPMPEV